MSRFLTLSGREAVFFGKMNPVIENLTLKDRGFEGCLNLLMDLGSSSYKEIDQVLHIFDVDPDHILDRYGAREEVTFLHRRVGEVLSVIPPDLTPSGGITTDETRNSLLLWGFDEEVERIKDLLLMLDSPREDLVYREYVLRFRLWDELQPLLPENLILSDVIPLPQGTGVLAGLTRDQQEKFRIFLESVDRPEPVHPVKLNFIKAEDVLKSLPPGFTSSDLEVSGNPSLLYFTGSQERYQLLLESLREWDKPVPQIRYDLLVIEYTREKQTTWDFSISNSVLEAGDQPSYLGALGNLLALNFDIPSAFGYAFSLKLNADINNSRAKVLVDTSLCALSGQEVRFQNSNTYRYRDTVKDLETGSEEATGVSREITSGLFINIEGWVSGAEMITMNVSTTVSKRGDTSAEATGILPPTSEKVIKTHIRTAAGKPVIIGGLVQREAGVVEGKTPILGSIPLAGVLFQRRFGADKNTEMVIYIVPHLESPQGTEEMTNLERLYDKYGYLFP
jgi:type II secretory pathway component GspD/PulD (secretin)